MARVEVGRSVGVVVVGLEEKRWGWDFWRAMAWWAAGERSRREVRERSSFRRRAVAEAGGESGSFSCREEGRVGWPWRRWSIRRMRSSSPARVSAAVVWDMFFSSPLLPDGCEGGVYWVDLMADQSNVHLRPGYNMNPRMYVKYVSYPLSSYKHSNYIGSKWGEFMNAFRRVSAYFTW